MSHLIEQAFGHTKLYEILKVAKDCTLAQLRKAYYKQALVFHPDKNDSDEAKLKFQAISWAYQFLKDPTKRAEYDEDGVLPREDEEAADEEGTAQWKDYFDTIFGKVSVSDIDKFAMKYKMSEEEEKDVLSNYEKFRGDLLKMLEYVMLSEERDAFRWMEDYIKPAIESGRVKDYSEKSQKVLAKVQKKLDKEKSKQAEANAEDPDRTETEESENEESKPRKKAAQKKKTKDAPIKGKKTKAKGGGGQEDLIAAIQNRRRGGGNPFAALGARYGVSMDDGDPLDDDTFARLQAKYKKKK